MEDRQSAFRRAHNHRTADGPKKMYQLSRMFLQPGNLLEGGGTGGLPPQRGKSLFFLNDKGGSKRGSKKRGGSPASHEESKINETRTSKVGKD